MKSNLFFVMVIVGAVMICTLARSPPKDKCDKPCTDDLHFKCGTRENGTTYQFVNQCDYDIYTCKHPGEIKSTVEGPCL